MPEIAGRVQVPEGMWVCRCNYQNIGPICTHCGRVPEPTSGRVQSNEPTTCDFYNQNGCPYDEGHEPPCAKPTSGRVPSPCPRCSGTDPTSCTCVGDCGSPDCWEVPQGRTTTCEATCAYVATDGVRWAVTCHFQTGHPGKTHTDGSVTWTAA